MPSSYIVFHLGFRGWERNIHEAGSEEEAMIADIRATHKFLKDEPIKVVFENGQYNVFYDGESRTHSTGSQKKGDYWFAGRIHIGQEDDCLTCAGTGTTEANPYWQCAKCGDYKKKGRGPGKIKNFPRYKDKMVEDGVQDHA